MGVVTLADPDDERSDRTAQSFGLLARLTHNEIQASLGLWTT